AGESRASTEDLFWGLRRRRELRSAGSPVRSGHRERSAGSHLRRGSRGLAISSGTDYQLRGLWRHEHPGNSWSKFSAGLGAGNQHPGVNELLLAQWKVRRETLAVG